jgi:hypothetical protein
MMTDVTDPFEPRRRAAIAITEKSRQFRIAAGRAAATKLKLEYLYTLKSRPRHLLIKDLQAIVYGLAAEDR